MNLYTHLIVIFTLLTGIGSFAQIENPSKQFAIEIPFQIFKSQDESLSLSDVLEQVNFHDPETFHELTHPDDSYWIRLDFSTLEMLPTSNTVFYLKHNTFGFAKLYYHDIEGLQTKPIGRFDKNSWSHLIKAHKYYSETPIYLSQLIQNRFLYFKVKRVQFRENPTNWKFSLSNESTRNLYQWEDLKNFIPTYINAGIGLVMCVLIFVFFTYFKKPEFFFYSLFVFLHLIYLIRDELQLLPAFSGNGAFEINWFLDSLAMLVAISYMLFAIYYIHMKRDYPFAYKVFFASIVLHGVAFLLDILFYATRYYEGHNFFQTSWPALTMVTSILAFGYIIANVKNKISVIFLVGSICLVLGVSTHYYLTDGFDPLLYNKFYIITGATLETVIFAFGLTYKVHIEHIEKLNFQKEAFANKTKALRAQINPHFIFNSLSSIQHLVTSNDRMGALKYLSKFSRLTRNILESSIETNVVLRDEIKMLKDYLELESLRFDNLFNYSVQLGNEINPNTIEIPFLILQPFVENAIIHGLLPKKNKDKQLTITFQKEDNFIVCEIDDNGVGRKVAAEREHIHRREKKSRGLEVTKQRLESLGDVPDVIEIIDKINDNGVSYGTTVRIKIPV